MTTRQAEANWKGPFKDGAGKMQTESGSLNGDYSCATRFRDASGANPEELLGAAHAGCYSMALAAQLERGGFAPEQVQTRAHVELEQENGGFEIRRVRLNTTARVPGIDNARFQQEASEAARQCVISKALAGTQVDVSAQLAS